MRKPFLFSSSLLVLLFASIILITSWQPTKIQANGGYTVYLPTILNGSKPIMPNDPYFLNETLWGLHNTGQNGGKVDADMNAPEAWALNTGSSNVIVAIIDTGVDLDHPEFSGRITNGYDFANNDENPDDDEGHGTHVAGTAAARGNNALGVAGVAWDVRIMPIKVLAGNGSGLISWSAEGVIYAADNNANVINMSLGGTYRSQALQDAINYAYNKGVLVVAAAGNCGDEDYIFNGCSVIDQTSYPAAMDHVLAVASTTRTDTQSSFSNQGNYVDIAAPGSSIKSTCIGGGYCTQSGTSMASPQVAGLAGLVFSQFPSYSPSQAAQAIVNNADDLGAAGRDDMYGCGRINAFNSLNNGAVNTGCSGWGGLTVSNQVTLNSMQSLENAEYQPGVLLVKYAENTSQSMQNHILSNNSLSVLDTIESLDILVVEVPIGKELETMAQLENNPAILYAEPDFLVQMLP